MNKDEELILRAWSRGLAGASARLAKRAWWVLEDYERRPPSARVGAWANAAEAQAWLGNFHAMGLLGLLDAPRVGRPLVHKDKLDKVKDQLAEWADEGQAGTLPQKRYLLTTMTQQEKEAWWRTMRSTGDSFLKNRDELDLPVPAPAGLGDLLCIHLASRIKVLAYWPPALRHSAQCKGYWLGIPNARIKESQARNRKQDLLDALSTEIRVGQSGVGQGVAGQGAAGPARKVLKLAKKEDALLERVLLHIAQAAQAHPGEVKLNVLVHLEAGPQLMWAFKRLRSLRLWFGGQRGDPPGLLADLCVMPYRARWAAAAQQSLAFNLQHVDGALLGELLDKLTLKRQNVFSWISAVGAESMAFEDDEDVFAEEGAGKGEEEEDDQLSKEDPSRVEGDENEVGANDDEGQQDL